jgi:hypothetical protein
MAVGGGEERVTAVFTAVFESPPAAPSAGRTGAHRIVRPRIRPQIGTTISYPVQVRHWWPDYAHRVRRTVDHSSSIAALIATHGAGSGS